MRIDKLVHRFHFVFSLGMALWLLALPSLVWANGEPLMIEEWQAVGSEDVGEVMEPHCWIYAVHDEGVHDSQFFTLEFDTFAAKALGPMHQGADIEGLAFHPKTHQLFASSGQDDQADSELYLVDPETGKLILVDVIRDAQENAFREVSALAFRPDGTLWGFARRGDPDRRGIIQIDPETGIAELIEQSNFGAEGLAWAPDGQTLWLSRNKRLYAYTPGGSITKAHTFGDLPGGIKGLESRPDGMLVVGLYQDDELNIYALDVESGLVAAVDGFSTLEFNDVESLAWPGWCGSPQPPTPTLEAQSSSAWTADLSSSRPEPGPELNLGTRSLDPVLESVSDVLPRSLTLDSYPAGVSGYYVVQFDGPILPEWKAALESSGAQLFDYVPDWGFVVKMDARARAVVEGLPHVRWVGIYQPGFRLEPSLLDSVSSGNTVTQQFIVIVFPGEDVDAIIRQLEALGGRVLDLAQNHWKSKIKLEIASASVSQVAAINGVRWVEPMPVFELANSEAADIIGARPVWQDLGLYGAGQVIGVCDTGLDQGLTVPASLHDDFEDGNGNSRVVALYDLVGGGDGAEDRNSGHGTHVAGSVLGNGDLSGSFPVTHTFYSTSYVGMAPDARLVFQAAEDDGGDLVGIPLDLNDLFTQTYTSGARIHSNSWGSGVPYGSYSSYSEDVDQFVWDNPDFLPFFAGSSGNMDADGDGVSDLNSVRAPGTAKNCVTVGATENDRPSSSTPTPGYDFTWGDGWPTYYQSDPINSDHVSDNPGGMAAFSGRGPTLDGRYKPDVVAPGTNIASTRSSLATSTGWGAIDANYMFNGGTSMATPLVAGGAALIREWYTRTQGLTPTAALMKATLVNAALDIYPGQYGVGAGQEVTPTAPNNVEGWGRVDVQSSISPAAPRRFQYVDQEAGLDTNGVHTYTFEIVTDSVPLRTNLVWSDYPGSIAAAGGLVNDLDLTLYGPGGAVFYPTNGAQHGDSQHLFYDDWGYDTGYYTAQPWRLVVRFTPTSYPVTLEKGLFFVASDSGMYPKTFNYYIYGDNGGGAPSNTPVASGSTTIRKAGWHTVDLSAHDVTVASGDFYLGIELADSDLVWLVDTAASDNRAWIWYNGSWYNYNAGLGVSEDVMFQAVVRSADSATSYDRVNNVVGIHVPTTTLQTGLYTLTVRGYNVPQGPQPYALALSGGLGELLDIGKTATPEQVEPDALLTYTIRITNTGAATAANVVLTETYDGNVTYQSATPSPSTGDNVWNLGNIGKEQTRLITVTVRTASGLTAGTVLTNEATVDSVQTDPRTAVVTNTITNVPPEAVDDNDSTDEDTPVAISVLTNDSDLNGDTLTVDSVGSASHGTVAFASS
ncbi:MAG: S8 family serine peptidase, partial [Chloroflexota bacterium]|nr:S8 family serine peptidase [Chloroflexota bacterium]